MSKYQDIIDEICVHDENNICGFFGRYRWLSNFHLCPVIYDGVVYPSSENQYQASKFNPEDRVPFLTYTQNQAKTAGQSEVGLKYSKAEWSKLKFVIMEEILRDKFKRNADMKAALISTGTKHIEERNFWGDVTWGTDKNGVGRNMLGKILMKIRDDLNTVQFDV